METIERTQTVKKHRFTVEEFRMMGEAGIFGEESRVELIDGEVIEMSPPGWRHVWYVKQLNRMLTRFAEDRRSRHGDGYEVSVQDPLVMDEHGQPQPDLMLMKGVPPGRLPNTGDALIVIEVSDTSLAYDRKTKLPRYAAAGVPEVWIYDIEAETIEVHSTPTPDGYRKTLRYGRTDHLESTTIPGLAFDTNDIFPPKEPEPDEKST
ncbi:MAG: Uma2 family endonuclease [Actinomycetota bacterium]|jgi:Uma2 family endonuclease|nr:Uma2 family endonuclease [Rubrobacter sp.]MDQ3509420.1 Uma2 family endonuclease [Actinomycetota bacterium]